jgi:biopolymer transport protein ExbB
MGNKKGYLGVSQLFWMLFFFGGGIKADMEQFAVFINFMRQGGPVNAVILALYVIVLAVFSERAVWFFFTRQRRRRSCRPEDLPDGEAFQTFWAALSSGEKRHAVYRMAAVIAHNAPKNDRELAEIIDREGAAVRGEMERGAVIFSFIGTVAPLLGLLGTITGLMNAFSQIEARGSAADITFLAGGIREAMITTATGLVTAIFALGAGKLFAYLRGCRLSAMADAVSRICERRGP